MSVFRRSTTSGDGVADPHGAATSDDDPRRRRVCAWCGSVVDEGSSDEVTHGMCRACAAARSDPPSPDRESPGPDGKFRK